MDELNIKQNLKDNEVLERVIELSQTERKTQGLFLLYLAEIERRQIHAVLGYSSLFRFCTEHLKYSEGSALKRIQAARAGNKFPQILEYIKNGEMTLKVVSLLSPYLKYGEGIKPIPLSRNKTTREVEKLIAAHFPKADKDDEIRRQKIETLSERRVHISFSADEELAKKVERAKQLLSNKYPQLRLEHVFNEALDVLLDKIDPLKQPSKETTSPPAPTSRYIPKSVNLDVWKRDDAQCTYTSPEGKTCGARVYLQRDHIKPFGMGGTSTADNLTLVCKTHNLLLARQSYGRGFIEQAIHEARERGASV